MIPADWIVPEGPPQGVGALMTTRAGGSSRGPFQSMNLGALVGDDPAAVSANRRVLAEAMDATPVFLRQVHGSRVVRLTEAETRAGLIEADASFSTEPGRTAVNP